MVEHDGSTGQPADSFLIKDLKTKFPAINTWDINIIKIEDGIVSQLIPSKGSPDITNNILFYTYRNHEQPFEFPLTKAVERNLPLAVVKTVTSILSRLKGSNYNNFYESIVRPVLRNSPWQERVAILPMLDFKTPLYENLMDNQNELKSIAFNLGQTLLLSEGKEIYTKVQLKVGYRNYGRLLIVNRRMPPCCWDLRLTRFTISFNLPKLHNGIIVR